MERYIRDLITRYLLMVILALNNLYLIYFILTPLTISFSYLLLDIFYPLLLSGDIIILEAVQIKIVEACVAGSAYYLLIVLNLATPNIKKDLRIRMLIYSLLTFFIINVIRIFVLSNILIKAPGAFNLTHLFLWFGLSTIFVVGIWFYQVKTYKIKSIPFYSDLKNLYSKTR